jgi:hypothetical protein
MQPMLNAMADWGSMHRDLNEQKLTGAVTEV